MLTTETIEIERYEAAMETAIGKLAAARKRWTEEGTARRSDRIRQEAKLCAVILALAAMIPAERLRRFRNQLRDVQEPQTFRAGAVQDAILETLARERRREWTAGEIKEALRRQGVDADDHSVMNCVSYLIRTRRLRRIARGMYLDPHYNVAIVTSDEIRTDDIEKGGANEY